MCFSSESSAACQQNLSAGSASCPGVPQRSLSGGKSVGSPRADESLRRVPAHTDGEGQVIADRAETAQRCQEDQRPQQKAAPGRHEPQPASAKDRRTDIVGTLHTLASIRHPAMQCSTKQHRAVLGRRNILQNRLKLRGERLNRMIESSPHRLIRSTEEVAALGPHDSRRSASTCFISLAGSPEADSGQPRHRRREFRRKGTSLPRSAAVS